MKKKMLCCSAETIEFNSTIYSTVTAATNATTYARPTLQNDSKQFQTKRALVLGF